MPSDGSGFTAPGEPPEFPDIVHKSWGARAPYKADEKDCFKMKEMKYYLTDHLLQDSQKIQNVFYFPEAF